MVPGMISISLSVVLRGIFRWKGVLIGIGLVRLLVLREIRGCKRVVGWLPIG